MRMILYFLLVNNTVTAAFPLSDFFPFTFLITFLCFCTHIFIIVFRILFTHGDLYSVRFFRIILLCLISFVKVSQKKIEHWDIRVH